MKTLKRSLSAFVLMLAITVSAQAVPQFTPVGNDNIEIKTEPEKKEIDPAKLPAAVKDAIEGGEYAEWKLSKAYQITFEKDPEKVEYEVHFKNAEMQKEVELYTQDGDEIDD